MKPESQEFGLLNDVLAEAASADFEGTLLSNTLRAARHRRRLRQSSRALAVAGVFAAIAVAVWNARLSGPPVNVLRPALHLVSSQPLAASMIVATRPGNVAVVASSPATFVTVETGSIKDAFQEINDEQLLALVAGRPAALVRQGPHQAELFFLNPEDTNGFLLH